jgi:predicted metal-binding membrane protein
MLLMFAEGFASIVWMVALTALMIYEATGRHGQRAASIAGVALILAALATLSGVAVGGL